MLRWSIILSASVASPVCFRLVHAVRCLLLLGVLAVAGVVVVLSFSSPVPVKERGRRGNTNGLQCNGFPRLSYQYATNSMQARHSYTQHTRYTHNTSFTQTHTRTLCFFCFSFLFLTECHSFAASLLAAFLSLSSCCFFADRCLCSSLVS